MELLIVTGMSGAGKSQASAMLEDMGFFCVDNIPPEIIPVFVDLYSKKEKHLEKIAIVTDARGGNLFVEFPKVLRQLKQNGVDFKILFLDAADEVIIRRYKENRRRHPLAEDDITLQEAVKKERLMLVEIRDISDYVIDTSFTSNAQLKSEVFTAFSGGTSGALKFQTKSFGFKHGTDTEADLLIDVRCLPNPFYIEELREKTGLDKEVRDYVMQSKESKELFAKVIDFLKFSIPLYAKEGKSRLVVAFGCTGGQHRSVTFAELVGAYLKENGYECAIIHRDVQKR